MFNHAIRYYQLPVNPARITRLFVREGFYDYQEENDGNGGSELMHSSVTTILDPVQLTDLFHEQKFRKDAGTRRQHFLETKY